MSFDPEKVTYFGETDARGKRVAFGIKAIDRQRHMYVIGKTGMGKSTLLENMAAQDILNGEGMAFIDPHGSAAETLLEYIPEHRVNDVVYFAPFDMDNPVSFNVMEDVGADKRHLVVSGLMSTFKKIWVDAWSARMEYILTNTLLALIEYPNTTLLSVNRMLADPVYRAKVVDYVKDPAVKAYWLDEFANYTERFAAEALPAIQNKVGQFTGNPLIRNIIGQPHSSFDIRKMMDEKKILIVNLSKGLVGETNANLLGSMLTTRIYLAAMSRADLPVAQMKQMPNFYFYVDEFQSFANATFANILSEARKYHLNLIIAHQYIEQMEEDVRNAVFGNVGTTITFRVGPFDAEHLEKIFEPRFLAADLVNLGKYQIYLSLMIDGIGSPPFSAVTLGPIKPPEISYKEMAIAASRKNFAGRREEVEALVTSLHATERADGASMPLTFAGAAKTPAKKKPTERPKPNFENTILDKLRAQKSDAEGESAKPALEEVMAIPAVPVAEPEMVESDVESLPEVTAVSNKEITSPPVASRPQAAPETMSSPLKSLDELRAVLARISQEEKTALAKNGGEEVVRNGNPSRENNRRRDRDRREKDRNREPRDVTPKNPVSSGNLQDALRSAMKEAEPTTTPAPETPQPPRTISTEQKETKSNTPESSGQSGYVTPKQLERMMRVREDERPPLR